MGEYFVRRARFSSCWNELGWGWGKKEKQKLVSKCNIISEKMNLIVEALEAKGLSVRLEREREREREIEWMMITYH